MVKPYIDSYDNGKIVREFSEDVESDELIWHRDKRTREIICIIPVSFKFLFEVAKFIKAKIKKPVRLV